MKSLRRCAAVAFAFGMGSTGCSWLVTFSADDEDAGPTAPIVITAIEGTGSVRAVSQLPDDLVAPIMSSRRLRDVLVITGDGLAAVTRVALVSADLSLAFSDLTFVHEGAPDVSIRLSLPPGVRAGLYTLTLVGAASFVGGAQSASAQVFLLQGEPGPPGVSGAAGPAGPRGPAGEPPPASLLRVDSLSAGDASCARGGASVISGTDLDGDGFLDEEEVETSASACHGDPGLDCAGGTCVLAADLMVQGKLRMLGPSDSPLDVIPHITSPKVFFVGGSASADFADLPSALAALSGVRIASAASVTLRLEAGTHSLAPPLIIDHPDGQRLSILGANLADPSATVLELSDTEGRHGIRILGPGLASLNGMTIRNLGGYGGHGVNVEAARARVGPSLVIEDYAVGISAYRGAAVVGDGGPMDHIRVTGHRIGYYAQGALLQVGYAEATAPDAAVGSIGFHANLGGEIYASHSVTSGHTFGSLASVSSMIHAAYASVVAAGVVGTTHGFVAQYESSIDAPLSSVSSVSEGYRAQQNGSIIAAQHTAPTNVTKVYCAATYSLIVTAGGGNVVDCL